MGGRYISTRLPGTHTDWLRRMLVKATWLSLRDSGSVTAVAALTGQRPPLMPDSAVMMTGLPEAAPPARQARLAALMPRIISGWAPGTRYLCLQCGINYITGQEDLLAAQVAAVHAQTGLPVVAFADLPDAVARALAQDPAAMAAQASAVRTRAETDVAAVWAALDPE